VKTLLVAITSIGLSVAAQFSLKAGMSGEEMRAALAQPFSFRTLSNLIADKYVVGGFLLYGLSAVVWLWVLSKWDVSKAYPLVGLGFVVTVAVGSLMGEHVTFSRVLGVALICAGVVLVGRS
jgi:multidrug transporter EmrE-like cation transporter